ncbi:histone-lysine N-methyltransferase SUV39H2-like isoform X4 [Betta splendens]|uniref:Histone-lysine N-methyltransferase SUV39H2-like isoform X4 n=1 Tax=Betta splendens TaxID=158456 RepID=A0A9W2XNM1_BETSP|nr:histone-lysine N-methyltransferase SUV39H2-like isoform X4 [Betta splendens]
MATIRRRNTPLKDAIAHATRAIDKATELEVKYINSFKGRGLFAKVPYQKGDFIVEYRGELISSQESERRRGIYHSKCTVFMFDFCWKERMWCIDAAQEDDSLGRLVNDDHIYPNCKMKRVIAEGKPHLCLFALRDIKAGEEITYDYGGSDWPWRKQAKVQETASDTLSSEEVPQSPSPSKMQAKTQETGADTLSSEEVPQSPSVSEMQAKTQETSADTLSSEEVPQSPSVSKMQRMWMYMRTMTVEQHVGQGHKVRIIQNVIFHITHTHIHTYINIYNLTFRLKLYLLVMCLE